MVVLFGRVSVPASVELKVKDAAVALAAQVNAELADEAVVAVQICTVPLNWVGDAIGP